jgi:subtilase family serine protease
VGDFVGCRGSVGRFHSHPWVVAGTTILVASLGSGAALGSPLLGTSPRPAVTDVGSAAALPVGSVRLGTARASTPLVLDVALKPRDPAALERFALAVSTPGSPSYRHYIAQGQFGRLFGPSASSLARIEATLRGLGLAPSGVSRNRLLVSVHTTVARAEHALRLSIDRFALPSGRVIFANRTAPMLPGTIAPSVQAVVGLDDVTRLVPGGGGARAAGKYSAARSATAGPKPCASASKTGAETANRLASAYGFGGLYSAGDLGQGETIALFEAAAFRASDISTYQHCYHTATKVSVIPVDRGTSLGSGTLEATTDVDDLIGLAPKARIRVYETSNVFSPNWLDEWARIVDDDKAQVVSTSWLACEKFEPRGFAATENTLFQQAASQGQTLLAASGDYGSEACDQFTGSTKLAVDDAASQPFATGVGGTEWKSRTPPRSGEKTWNAIKSGSSGGGLSSDWKMPSWQTGPGVVNKYSSRRPCGAASGYCREVPDVSALAGSPYYAFYCKAGDCSHIGGWGYFWGTSFATPLWAAAIALADENCTSSPRAGFLNPALFAVASSGSYAAAFHDITRGENDFTHSHGGRYPATARYDLATGLGTPIFASGSSPSSGLAAALCT